MKVLVQYVFDTETGEYEHPTQGCTGRRKQADKINLVVESYGEDQWVVYPQQGQGSKPYVRFTYPAGRSGQLAKLTRAAEKAI